MTHCRACGAPIIWIKTPAGKSMPCNAGGVFYWQKDGGKSRVVTANGEVVSCVLSGDTGEATGIGYIPHWATCKAPEKFRKR